MDGIESRIKKFVDEIVGEALLDMLDTDAATEMLQWGIAPATSLVKTTDGLDDITAEQPEQLRHLREVAVKVMREFAAFNPLLVGAVLNGTANQFSEVTIQLFADDEKSLALFLVNRRFRFEQAEKRVRVGEDWVVVPQFYLEMDGAPVTLSVYALGDEHLAPRGRPEAEGPQRARLADVEALLGS